MSLYQCNNCMMEDCLLCPTNFGTSCKLCSTNPGTTCVAESDYCPKDYYSSNGICLRCPPGCSACNSARNCSECDASLVLYSNLTHRICKCPDGKFGTPNMLADSMVCGNCDVSKCEFCENSPTYCT